MINRTRLSQAKCRVIQGYARKDENFSKVHVNVLFHRKEEKSQHLFTTGAQAKQIAHPGLVRRTDVIRHKPF